MVSTSIYSVHVLTLSNPRAILANLSLKNGYSFNSMDKVYTCMNQTAIIFQRLATFINSTFTRNNIDQN